VRDDMAAAFAPGSYGSVATRLSYRLPKLNRLSSELLYVFLPVGKNIAEAWPQCPFCPLGEESVPTVNPNWHLRRRILTTKKMPGIGLGTAATVSPSAAVQPRAQPKRATENPGMEVLVCRYSFICTADGLYFALSFRQ